LKCSDLDFEDITENIDLVSVNQQKLSLSQQLPQAKQYIN